MTQSEINHDYNWPLVKYDHKKRTVIARWQSPCMCTQEPAFVANPNSQLEEDGLLLVMGYNFEQNITSLFVIDPATM